MLDTWKGEINSSDYQNLIYTVDVDNRHLISKARIDSTLDCFDNLCRSSSAYQEGVGKTGESYENQVI